MLQRFERENGLGVKEYSSELLLIVINVSNRRLQKCKKRRVRKLISKNAVIIKIYK